MYMGKLWEKKSNLQHDLMAKLMKKTSTKETKFNRQN